MSFALTTIITVEMTVFGGSLKTMRLSRLLRDWISRVCYLKPGVLQDVAMCLERRFQLDGF